MILNVKAFISIRYDININGTAFCTVINSAQFSHLNPSITLGTALPLSFKGEKMWRNKAHVNDSNNISNCKEQTPVWQANSLSGGQDVPSRVWDVSIFTLLFKIGVFTFDYCLIFDVLKYWDIRSYSSREREVYVLTECDVVDFLQGLTVLQWQLLALSSGRAKNRSLNTELAVSPDMLSQIYQITRYHMQHS